MTSADEDGDGRSETAAQRADRNWNELLQEFRVLQTGVQILGAFLVTLPFQSRFGELDEFQERFYLGLVLLATASTALMLCPIAVHRRMFQWRRKERLVQVGHRLARINLLLIGLLVAGVATFVFDVVVSRTASLVVGAGAVLLVVVLLYGVPVLVGGRRPVR